jgi:hypothetical protein
MNLQDETMDEIGTIEEEGREKLTIDQRIAIARCTPRCLSLRKYLAKIPRTLAIVTRTANFGTGGAFPPMMPTCNWRSEDTFHAYL